MSTYLRPTAPIAADVVLTANPAEAMALAQALIEGPLMANHSHGLWGYSGPTATGRELTVQSTGIGGPSAAAVLFELASLGVRRAVCVGRGRPLAEGLAAHTTVLVAAAMCGDGTSRALGDGELARPDAELTGLLRAALNGRAQEGTVLSRDLHVGADDAEPERGDALVADLETAALLAAGDRCGVAVAAALVCANGDGDRARDHILALGQSGAAALARPPTQWRVRRLRRRLGDAARRARR